jgi:hypothetical protein
MRGTILCGVNDSEAGRGALELAAELADRLGLRLVVAHVADGIPPVGGDDVSKASWPAGLRRRLRVPVLIAPPRTPRARQAAA